MKMKLLSPAGDFESLKMAVYYGADEVYLGVKDFNARNIEGFNLESLKQAIDFAHIYGVKVHLTVNILFSDDELQSALNLIVDAYNLGVDAFIIQDIGLASLVHKFFPEIEMHASTQMGIHNLEDAKVAKEIGFKRVVLARETPLSEIKRIKDNLDIEIEYFAHGALCVCFSGNCYLSSKLLGASGNRGKCKQLCRLPFSLMKDNKKLKTGFLLSAKDFNMLKRLKDLEDAGVCSIKIEGRARRPFYVAAATAAYRSALDGKNFDEKSLLLAFNRDFTEGYFNGNSNIISKFNNHIGIFVGKIKNVKYGKNFNEFTFSSTEKISKKSVIKLFKDGTEFSTISLFDLQEISPLLYHATTTQKVETGLEVRLISNFDMETETVSKIRKLDVSLSIKAIEGTPIKAKVNYKNINFELEGEVCLKAQNQPLSKSEIENCFSKNEFFIPQINFETDNAFLTKKQLNEFRRNVYENLIENLTTINHKKIEKIELKINKNIKKFDNFQIIENVYEKFIENNIIYSPEIYLLNEINEFKEKCDEENKNAFLFLPNFAAEKDIILLEEIVSKTKVGVVATNLYALLFKTNLVAGGELNIYNSVSANFLNIPILSAENNLSTKVEVPFMTLKHCPMKEHLGAKCSACPYTNGFKYVMQNGKTFSLKRKKLSSCTFYLV